MSDKIILTCSCMLIGLTVAIFFLMLELVNIKNQLHKISQDISLVLQPDCPFYEGIEEK